MDPFKNFRSELERNIVRAWSHLSEGWRELLSRSGPALTNFAEPANGDSESEVTQDLPTWSLLSADVWETAKSVIARVEIPGMEKNNFDISIHGSELCIRGEKRFKGDRERRLYHLMERAYGHFERIIALPQSVDGALAEVSYQDGVLTVILPKTEDIPPRQLDVR